MSTQEKPAPGHCIHSQSPITGAAVSRAGGSPRPPLPEVFRCQHFTVVQELTLGTRTVQSRQDILHPWEAAGHTLSGTVNLPLEQVDARPLSHMGTLKHRTHSKTRSSWG